MALPWLKIHEITTMSAGKGDSPRRVDTKRYNENYERIFRKPSTEDRVKLLKLLGLKKTDEHERNTETTIEQEAEPEAEIRLRVGEEKEPAPRQED
jgi:hypothetical protein